LAEIMTESNTKITVAVDENGQIIESNNYDGLSSSDKSLVQDFVENIISSLNEIIKGLAEHTKIPYSKLISGQISLIDLEYSYLTYLEAERQQNGEQGLRDEAVALAQAVANKAFTDIPAYAAGVAVGVVSTNPIVGVGTAVSVNLF